MSVKQPPPSYTGPTGDQAPQPPQDHKTAKANAKAATAYAKAQRPWYKKKRFMVLMAIAAIVVIIIATQAGGGGGDTTATNDTNTTQADTSGNTGDSGDTAPADNAPAADTSGGTDVFPIQNGDWRLDSVRVADDGFGDFGATARVTYTGDDSAGGNNLFTLTVFVAGKDVAALMGSANTVLPGDTATVQFIGTEPFVNGKYKYDFQNDL